jgi:Domain of unknown function (DUF4288)
VNGELEQYKSCIHYSPLTIDHSRQTLTLNYIIMKWYLAKMVFRIICGEGEHTPQFDEQLRLVAGLSKEEAFQKAREMGKKEEEAFYNSKDQLVQWQFINISELYLLNELIDGAELYSRIEEKENADAYIYTVNQKASTLFFNHSSQLLQLA